MNQPKQQTPFSVANFFLEKEKNIDNLKLNKIVYISLGFSLAENNFDLFAEQVEAWNKGPVIPSIYHHFKDFGNKKIDRLANTSKEQHRSPKIDADEKKTLKILDGVWKIYKSLNGVEMIKLTHQQGTPWSYFYTGRKNVIIDKNIIKKYYKAFMQVVVSA